MRLRFETDLATSLKASADLRSAMDKVGDSLGDAAGEARKLELAAKRIIDQNLTPQQRYNRKLEEHAKLVKTGRLSVEDATRSLANYRTRLETSMGGGALKMVRDHVGGFASLAGGLGLVSQALRQMSVDSQSAADRIFQSVGSFGELQQVSASPQDFIRNVARARSLVRTGVVSPDQQGLAADLVFGMVSAGYTEPEKNLLAQIGRAKFVKSEGLLGLAEGLGKYRNLFGERDAGSLRDITNKVIATAGTAQASVPETLKALLEVGEGAKGLGLTDEQASAAFLAIEAKSPGADVAATKLRSFFEQVQKRGLFRGDIPGTIAHIQGRLAGGKGMFDVLGEGRAVQAFGNLSSSLDFLRQQEGLITAAPQRDLLGARSRFLQRDPTLRAAAARQAAEGEFAFVSEALDSERENLFDTLRSRRLTRAKQRGRLPELKERLNQLLLYNAADFLNIEDSVLGGAASRADVSPREREEIKSYLRRAAEGIERLQGTTDPPRASGRQE